MDVSHSELLHTMFELPGPQAWMQRICDDLGSGVNVLLISRSEDERELLRERLGNRLGRDDLLVYHVDTDDHIEDPLDLLSGGEIKQRDRWEMMLEGRQGCPLGSIDVLWIRIPYGSIELQAEWRRFLTRWAGRSMRDDTRGMSMLMESDAASELVRGDLGPQVQQHCSAVAFGAVELRQALRRVLGDRDHWETVWGTSVTSAIAGNDSSLAVRLVHHVFEPVESLMAAMRSFRLMRPREFEPKVTRDGQRSRIAGPEGAGPVWDRLLSMGAATSHDSWGYELHPAILDQQDRFSELRGRIWRGQAAVLFPWLDTARRAMCRAVETVLGPRWGLRECPPEDHRELDAVRKDEFNAGFGQLASICRKHRSLQMYAECMEQSKDLRNDIAHYQPVDFSRVSMWKSAVAPLVFFT